MMYDPQCEVICDECGAREWWYPEYVYHDFSGTSGHYDTSSGAYQKWLKSIGWQGDGDNDRCDSCIAAAAE